MIADNCTRAGIIVNVHDGDTFDIEIDLLFDVKRNIKLRLARVNTPEVFGDQRPQGLNSKEFVESNFLNQKINVIDKGIDTFRRNLGEVYVIFDNIEQNLSDLLVSKNLAVYENFK